MHNWEEVALDTKLSTHVLEFFIVILFPIVSHDRIRYIKLIDDVSSDEIACLDLGDSCEGLNLYPFGEAINDYNDILSLYTR